MRNSSVIWTLTCLNYLLRHPPISVVFPNWWAKVYHTCVTCLRLSEAMNRSAYSFITNQILIASSSLSFSATLIITGISVWQKHMVNDITIVGWYVSRTVNLQVNTRKNVVLICLTLCLNNLWLSGRYVFCLLLEWLFVQSKLSFRHYIQMFTFNLLSDICT